MLIKLTNGTVYDPIYCKNGVIEDIFIQNERIVTQPDANIKIDKVYDLTGKIVMAGAIDLHSHISGGQINVARLMFPEDYVIDTAPNPPSLKRNGNLFKLGGLLEWVIQPRLNRPFYRCRLDMPI